MAFCPGHDDLNSSGVQLVYTQNIKEMTWINLFQAKGQTQASGIAI